ncbi:ion channel [Nocardioides korecus]
MDTPTGPRPSSWGPFQHPSAMLLAAQLLAVLAYPFLDGTRVGSAFLGALGMIAVLLAVRVVRSTPALTVVALVIGVPALALTVLEAFYPGSDTVALVGALLHAPFYFYVAYSTIRYLFHDQHVTTDELYAIGAAFTVVAWAFCYVFVAITIVWPGSIDPLTSGSGRFFELLFFSFTNLTSVGLSDILPVGDHARSVVILEQVAGVLYVAMVISRLVAMTVRENHSSDG